MNTSGLIRASLIAFCAPTEEVPDDLNIPFDTFPFGRMRWLLERTLRHRLRARIESVASVHIHGIWQEHCQIAASIARQAGVPYVISTHGMLEPWALKQKAWKKAVYALLSERFTVTRAAGMRALTVAEVDHIRAFGYKGPVEVIPNGIDAPANPDPQAFWELYPDLRGKKVVLFLGRLHKKKGIEALCHSWKEVESSVPDGVLVFAGPDSDETPGFTEQLAQELGILPSVRFAGMLRGNVKWAALRAATVFVLPSLSEGFSVATLEALACTTPVIISDACYFPEVREHDCGWVISPDVQSLSAALVECLRLPSATIHTMGLNGKQMIDRSYQWPLIGRNLAATHLALHH